MKNKIILSAVLVASLFTAPVVMADEYNECHGTAGCTAHVTGKILKKIVSVPRVVLSGAAEAGKTYLDGGDAGEVIGAGFTGAGEQVIETVSETAKDTVVVVKAGLKATGNAIIWGISKLSQ